MIQSDLHCVICPEAEKFVRGKFFVGVETLEDAARELSFGVESGEPQGSAAAKHTHHLFHWFDLRPHDIGESLIEESTRPVWRDIGPECLEFVLEQLDAH